MTVPVTLIYTSIAGVTITISDDTPEGAVTAKQGSAHFKVDDATIYVKSTDGGTDGWIAASGGDPGGNMFVGLDDVNVDAEESEGYVAFMGPNALVYCFPPAGADVILESGAADDDATGAGIIYIHAGAGDAGGGGGNVEIKAGADDPTGNGAGDVIITGGFENTTGAGGAGSVEIKGGQATDTTGGDVIVQGGTGTTGSAGGSVSITGGQVSGGGIPGSITLTVTGAGLISLIGVPAIDPEVVGALYTTAGALMVSEG